MTHRRTILLLISAALVLAGGTLFVSHATAATSTIGGTTYFSVEKSSFTEEVIAAVLYYILEFFGWILGIAGSFLNLTFQPGPLVWSSVVQTGWKITRDFANMFFILILLGIALDYILFQSFGVRRALPRLALVALLINFGLPIAGVVIDFANVFTSYFIEQLQSGCGMDDNNCAFSEAIAQRLNLQGVTDGWQTSDAENLPQVNAGIILDVLFAIFLVLGTTFVFFAMGLMFLLRAGYLMILLILLPLVLVLWTFPPTAGRFGAWTHSFLRWAMFAPVATFFLYLSLLTLSATVAPSTVASAPTSSVFASLISPVHAAAPAAAKGFFQTVMVYIVAWMFMLGSLYAANSFGIRGASTALAGFSRAGRWARGRASQAGKAAARTTGRAVGADTMVSKAAELAGRMGLGPIDRALQRGAQKTKAAIAPTTLSKEEEQLIQGMSSGDRQKYFDSLKKSGLSSNKARAAQVGGMMAKKGELAKEDFDIAYKLAKESNNREAIKTIGMTNPEKYAKEIEKEFRTSDGAQEIEVDGVKTIKRKDGKLLSKAHDEIFRSMTQESFENMEWTQEGMTTYLQSNAVSQRHLQMAMNAGNKEFSELLESGIEELGKNEEAWKNFEEKNRNFVRAMNSGALHDLYSIGKPRKVAEKEAEEEKKKEEKPKRRAGIRPGGIDTP